MNDKETLEEFALEQSLKIYGDYDTEGIQSNARAFIKIGAKWQSERMYSEEEVGELLYNAIGEYGKHYGVMIDGKMLNDLFEQFKKK